MKINRNVPLVRKRITSDLYRYNRKLLFIYLPFLFFLFVGGVPNKILNQDDTAVVPIHWKSFRNGNPTDSLAFLEEEILLNANQFALTTWYDSVKSYHIQKQQYLDFGGIIQAAGSYTSESLTEGCIFTGQNGDAGELINKLNITKAIIVHGNLRNQKYSLL